jgi:hypothetical protein
MTWGLIKSIQAETDMRLIMPFGLGLKLGDVISVGKDGGFTLQGSCNYLLGLPPGGARGGAGGTIDLMRLSGKTVGCAFRAAGTASSLFPKLPTAQAGFDISFATADSWLLALTGRTLQTIETAGFRRPILDAYAKGTWRPDWALVTSIASVDRMTLLASSTANTNVALSIGASVAASAAMAAKLTADVSIVTTNEQLVQCVTTAPSVAFCNAIRVQDPWWAAPDVGTLGFRKMAPRDLDAVTDAEFWEEVDVATKKTKK